MNSLFDPMAIFAEDRMDEVVIVPCGGCEMGQLDQDVLQSLLPDGVVVSLPSLLAGVTVSRRRLELAHAVIGLSACRHVCAHTLVQPMRPTDFHIDVSNMRDPTTWGDLIRRQIGMLCEPDEATDVLPMAGNPLSMPAEAAVHHYDIDEPEALDEEVEELDFTGLKCPMPIIELSKFCRNSNKKHLEILADDRAFPSDIKAWCAQRGAELLGVIEEGGVYRAELQLKRTVRKRSTRTSMVLDAPSQNKELPLLESIDCTSMFSPLQIVELQKALGRHSTPGTIKLITRDPQFVQDVEHWCHQSDAVLLHLDVSDEQIEADIAINLQRENEGDSVSSHVVANEPGLSLGELRDTAQQLPLIVMPSTGPWAVDSSASPEIESFDEFTDPRMPLVPSEFLDYTGLRCPMPIVRLAGEVRQKGREVFQITADDAAFSQDLRAWCEQNGYAIEAMDSIGRKCTAIIVPEREQNVPSSSSVSVRAPMRATLPLPDGVEPVAVPKAVEQHMAKVDIGSVRKTHRSLQRTDELAQIRTGEVLQVRSMSEEQDFASSGKQVVSLDSSTPTDEGFDLTTNPKLPRLSLLGANGSALSRETTEFSLRHGPRELSELLPQASGPRQPKVPESSALEEPDLSEVIPLELVGLKCPLPIVRLAAKVREFPEATFSLRADDAAFPPDVKAWCSQSGRVLLSLETIDGVHKAIIAPPGTPPPKPKPQKTPSAVAKSLESPAISDSSDDVSLFEEMKSFEFWDNELPTQPVSTVSGKDAVAIDLRGNSAMQCVDLLKGRDDAEGVILHLKIDPSISLDNFQLLCELNHFTCIAANATEDFGEVWLRRLQGL